jgi:hypothetical protein
METNLLKQNCIDGIFKKRAVRALEVQTQNVSFLGTGFAGHTDIIIVR